jgi:hypothetical protein
VNGLEPGIQPSFVGEEIGCRFGSAFANTGRENHVLFGLRIEKQLTSP